MTEILGSRVFKDFYKKMVDDAESSESYVGFLTDAFKIISEPMHIGRFDLFINSPSSPIEIEGLHDHTTVYENPEGYNYEAGMRETFVTSDFGIIQVEIYPDKGHEWDAEETEEIEFLILIVHQSCMKVRLSRMLSQATITDPVTGALNTTGVTNILNEKYKDSTLANYVAVCINIKNFYYINNRIGHVEGDKVLRSFCYMIREHLEKGEVFGRLGGDNFFILIEKDRIDEMLKYVSTRRVLVEAGEKSQEFDLMVRLGIYKIHPVDTPARVMNGAKTAYNYTRNPSYGSVVWFEDTMLDSETKSSEVSGNFKKALQKKEFVVYYQPKVDLNTSRLISAEALCRWVKDGEIVPPMEFIPVLEKEGTIGNLDFYMLNEVCEHIRDWITRGIEPVRISVNFSRANLLNKKLADKILKVINANKVDTKYLEIEITEMSGYEDFESLSEFVRIMKENGIETSIDDFGTGYSSLNLIKDLHVDTIKLDRTFLMKIEKGAYDVQDRSVVKNIVNMVNELNMKVVAEGVETVEQMEFLKQINCDAAQGFLFDKPLPKEKFEFRLIGERMY